MKKLLTFTAAALFAVTLLAPRAEAQLSFLPYAGYNTDAAGGSFLIGVGAEFGIGMVGLPIGLALRPSAEYVFGGGDVDLTQFNVDAIGRFSPPLSPVGFYAGAGLGILNASFDGNSSTDLGLNLLGGAEFGGGFAVPFAQARLTIADGSAFSILGGVRFGL